MPARAGQRRRRPVRGAPAMSCPAFFQSLPRRQARPMRGVAAGQDSCAPRIAAPFAPRTPQRKRRRRLSGETLGARGAGHRFSQCRGTGRVAKTRGWGSFWACIPHGCKAGARFGLVDSPQVAAFYPRVWPFSPYVAFRGARPFFFFSSSFLEERERKRGAAGGKAPSTGLETCNWKCPQVEVAIHGFFVAVFLSGIVVWRGFAGGGRGYPRPTAGNACVPPCAGLLGGKHGA